MAETIGITVGLTGLMGSGKTTVADMLARLGAQTWSADQYVRSLLDQDQSVRTEIVASFGSAVMMADQQIDRYQLAKSVFANDEQLKRLESIIHPKVKKQLKDVMRHFYQNTEPVLVAEIPLLFEAGLDEWFDYTAVLSTPMELCLQRFLIRSGLTENDFKQRIRRQMSLEKKISLADFLIDNSKNLSVTFNQVKKLWQDLLQETKQNRSLTIKPKKVIQ